MRELLYFVSFWLPAAGKNLNITFGSGQSGLCSLLYKWQPSVFILVERSLYLSESFHECVP